jgi:hypothetical protein
LTGLLLLTLAGLAAITWWSLLKGKEQARGAASVTCREHGLRLMDDTVVLDSIRLIREEHSRSYRLRYRFEYARDGILHKGGSVLIAPGQRPTVIIRTSSGELIQEI